MMHRQNQDDKTIYTAQNDPIPWLEKDVNTYLDKNTLIFGGTGSGKTTVIEEILYLLKDSIPNFVVIAPKTSDGAYRRKLPEQCIKDDLTKEKILKIWERQLQVTKFYNIANDITVLESLYKLAPDMESEVMIDAIKTRTISALANVSAASSLNYGQKQSQKTAIEELRVSRIKDIYKNAIKQKYERLRKIILELSANNPMKAKLTTALYFFDMNPRLCLIIDDCSEKFQRWMKFFKKNEDNPLEAIFYKGRHNYITVIIASHDDKLINTELRKNARVIIYTNSQSLITSITRAGNGYSAKEQKEAARYASKVFGDDMGKIKTHQKLCYIREDSHPFKYLIANIYPEFSLVCDPTRQLVNRMPQVNDNLESDPVVQNLMKGIL